ncbi:MAG: Ig-like domain-containing protein, partial [Chloroflexota bacterium]
MPHTFQHRFKSWHNITASIFLLPILFFLIQLQPIQFFNVGTTRIGALSSDFHTHLDTDGHLTISVKTFEPIAIGATNSQITINDQLIDITSGTEDISIHSKSSINIGSLTLKEGMSFTAQSRGDLTVNDSISAPVGNIRLEAMGDISIFGSIDVNGHNQGGTLIIGNNPKAEPASQYLAQNVIIDQNVHLSADAIVQGNGGNIIIWAEKDTQMYGSVSARGGVDGGNGGFVEVSGKETWRFPNWAERIDITSPNGAAGHFLLDPNDISIVNGSGSAIGSSPTNANTLNDADIQTFLQNTGSLTIETTGTGGNGDITIDGDVSIIWTSGSNLTINADRSISMSNGLVIRTTAGNLTFNANTSGTATGNFTGISQRGKIETIGSGDISFTAIGGDDAASGQNSGMQIWGTVESSGSGASAGTITLHGTAVAGTNINYPVSIRNKVTSVDGDIQITGINSFSTTGFLNHGIHIQSSQVTSTGTSGTAASITLNGAGGGSSNNNNGVRVEGATAEVSAVAGDINITGQGGSGSLSIGLIVMQGGQIQSTGTGASAGTITINATGGTSQGVRIDDADSSINSVDGDMNINGTGGGSSQGIRFLNSSDGIVSTGSSNITLTGTSTNNAIQMNTGAIGGPSHNGNITLIGDLFRLDGGTIQSSGSLLIEPLTAGTTIGLGGGSGTLNLTDTELSYLIDGFSSITIGKSDAGNMTINTAVFTDPLTLLTANNISNSSSGGTDLTAPSITFNGTVAPNGTFGVSGNSSFANNSELQLDLSGTPSGGTHDQLTVAGTVTIGSNVGLTLSTGSYSDASGTITAVSNDDSDTISGTFSGLSEGSDTNPGTNPNFIISYFDGSGNDITLSDTNTADLSITVSDSPDPVDPTQNLTYSFNVTNGSSNPAYNVVSNVTLPTGVTFVSSSGCAESPTGGTTCSLGTISSSSSSSFQIVVSVGAATSGDMTLSASVSSSTTDPSSGNNSDSETTTVGTPPVLAAVTPLSPADNGANVALDANLIATFDETIQAGSGNITIHLSSDDSVVHTLAVTGSNVSISGSQLTINPPADLDYLTEYYINIPATAVEDIYGIPFAGILNTTSWNFTTIPDTTPPTLSMLSPADGAVDIALASNLVITLSESVQKGTGNITIHLGSDDSVVQTIDVTGTAVSISGNEVTINPPTVLSSGTDYYVNISSGAIEDLAANDYAGFSDTTTWNFTTADVIPPSIATLAPADDETAVVINSNLTMTFTENIQANSGNITIHLASDDSVIHSLPVTGGNVSISGAQLTINPPADFTSETEYYVNIPAGTVQDLSSNNFAGISDSTTWNFTSADVIAPSITSLMPVDNEIDVLIDSNLTITFSENIQVNSGNITIHLVSNDSVIHTLPVTGSNVSVSGSQLTINPPADFASETEYYVNIPASTVQDLSSNNFAGISDSTTWNFTSADVIAPSITSLIPVNNEIDVLIDSNLSITFTENIQANSGNITIHLASDDTVVHTLPVNGGNVSVSGAQLIIDPPVDFASETEYYVNIPAGAVQDLSSNNFAGILDATTWSFTAEDVIAPTVSTLTPVDNDIDVPVDSNLTVTFDENIQANSGNISIHLASDDSVIHSLPVTGGNVSVSGTQLIINPPTDFASETGYYVNMLMGTVQDLSGNNFAGILSSTIWNFTSADVIAPSISSISPVDNKIDILIDSNLIVTFTESIQANSGNITIHLASDDSVVHTLPITGTAVSISGAQLTINPPSDFASETTYYVNIDGAAIQDLSGNNFAGIGNTSTWNFTSADVIAPMILTHTPLDDATTVPINSRLVILFAEDIQAGAGDLTIHDASNDAVQFTVPITGTAVAVDGNTLTITLASDFASLTSYYVNYPSGWIEDLSNNGVAGISDTTSWNFTTEDVLSPVVTTLNPADDAINVPISSTLTIEFDEAIQAASGNITIHLAADNSIVHTLAVTDTAVTISGNQLTIDPPADYASETEYYVKIEAGSIEDLSGNAFAGITDTVSWRFTSIDVELPYPTDFSTGDDSAGTSADGSLSIEFSEPIQAGTGFITIHNADDDSIVESFDITAVSINGNTLTFTPTESLDYATTYYITIPDTAIEDLTGNSFPGFTDSISWNFKTVNVELYLPVVRLPSIGPDLIVSSLDVQANQVIVEIQNIGDEPVVDDFWVDVYINPATPPTSVNDTLETLNAYGFVWGIT